jgi:hypothetical protein
VGTWGRQPDNDSIQNGGGHPWTIEHGANSTLLWFNHSTDGPKNFELLIGNGKQMWVNTYTLAPMETKAISINEIVEKQIPDKRGIRVVERHPHRARRLVDASREMGQRTFNGFPAAERVGTQLQLRKLLGAAKSPEDATWLESCAKDAIAFCGEKWRGQCSEELKSSNR